MDILKAILADESPDRSRQDGILEQIDEIENSVQLLLNKFLLLRNDNSALKKRIELLENENTVLKEKRDQTVSRLKEMLQKFENETVI